MSSIKKITISTGEASGEMHARALINALRDKLRDAQFLAMGSEQFRAPDIEVIVDTEDAPVLGLFEVFPKLGYFVKAYKKMRSAIRNSDIFIAVDNFGFNFFLIRYASLHNIPVFYFIPPKVWAWGMWRAKLLFKYTDRIYTLFPFEAEVLKRKGCNARFFGNPLFNTILEDREYPLEDCVIALLPGSRRMEVDNLLPVMLKTCELMVQSDKLPVKPRFLLSKAPGIKESYLEEYIVNSDINIEIVEGLELLERADVAIVCSGTASLETLIMGIPMIVIYRVSPITWMLGRMLAGVDFISLPNILADREIIPEILQDELTPHSLADAVINILSDKASVDIMMGEYRKVIEDLNPSGGEVYERIAGDIVSCIEK
jgi:lipid-A-disaccharide synthase